MLSAPRIACCSQVLLHFELPRDSFAVTGANGTKILYSGMHELTFSRDGATADTKIEVMLS